MKQRVSKPSSFIRATSSGRAAVAQLLIACLLLQLLAPAAFASAAGAQAPATATAARVGLVSRAGATLYGLAVGAGNMAAAALTYARAALAPQENWNVVLTPLVTDFHDHTGLDYHQPSAKLVLSANSPSGVPHSFELLGGGGGHSVFSNVAGFGGTVVVAAARDDGQGLSRGGFHPGELFTSNGVAGAIARLSADGATVQNPWTTLPGETGIISGLHVDRTGTFGGDLLVVTTAGGVWRVNSAAVATRVAALNTRLAGVVVVPDEAERYGPWAGRALVGAKDQGSVHALNAQGQADSLQVGLQPQDIDLVPAHENFFAVEPAARRLLGAPEGAFAGIIGDILITQKSPGVIARVRWDGLGFVVSELAQAVEFEQVAFSPAGVAPLPAVRQLYDKIAVVRHAPQLNSGRVEGTLWQLIAENVVLNGNDVITSDLLVPGTPNVTTSNPSNFGGTVEGTGDSSPSSHTISISGNASLRHVVTRTNPIQLQTIPAPPAPVGTRDVALNKAGETFGNAATLRNLSLSGKAGVVAVPPGTYGRFSASSHTTFVFGLAGSAEPSVYNLEDLSLTGGSELRLDGPVILTVKNSVTLSGSTIGAASDPRRLVLRISGTATANPESGVKLSGSSVLYGVVRAPQRDITITGNGRLRGTVACDYLFINGNGVLQITENDTPPPPVNRPPSVDAGPVHTITLPTDTTALEGSASDDGLPAGSTLTVAWTKVSGPGAVTFADPHAVATTATFGGAGAYTLRLCASDTEFNVCDDVVINVLKNEPPVVNAGPDLEVTLPSVAALNGTATDDGLPRGSTLEVSWSMVSGPGAVIFNDAFAAATLATFNAPGTYVLRLTASDSQLSAVDEATVVVNPQPFTSRTYTLDAEFDEGELFNVTHSTPNQLQLDSTTRSLNFIWVAVSTKGTVVKINTETGAIIGEYFTSPAGQPKDPSRTTVDQNGNVWATNREGNSVVHIGLIENGQCVDRNSNGVIDTSTGFDDIRAWPNTGGANTNGGVTLAQDECIIHYTKVNSFGTRHVSVNKDNDIWVSGTSGQRFDLIDGKTGVIKRSEPSVGYGGYGGLIDKAGVIWSANPMLRWDTSKPLTGPNALSGMAFTLFGGRATWDRAGKASTQPSPSESVWVEDSAPEGAALAGDGEGWNWTSANPTPFSGTLAHQSNINGGTHQHYFQSAAETLSVGAGDSLFTYVYLDPLNPPSQVMLQWNNGNWEHRAYWGQSQIPWGAEGTESRRHMGPLPALGQWVRLEVPASQVGLEGSGTNWRGYSHPSYGLCIDSQGNVYNTTYGNGTIRKFAPDGTLVGTYNQGFSYAQGCVVDRNDHVWIAHSLNGGTVGHMKSDGTYVGTVTVGTGPTGVAVDGAGKVWATNYYSRTVSRISPALGPLGPDGVTRIGAVDFTTRDLGGNPYNYSDMTGSTLTSAPLSGTWSVVFDSKVAGAEWGRVGWAAQVCGDAQLNVSVATGEDGATFGPAVAVANGADPVVANGRYLKVNVAFKRASSGESPVLQDLSVGTVGYALPTSQNAAPTAFAGPDQTTTLPDAAKLNGVACDDSMPRGSALQISWAKVEGPGAVVFLRPNSTATDVTFSAPGTYVLRLTAADSEHSVSDDINVTVKPANNPPVVNAGADINVTLPSTAALVGTASDDGLPEGSALNTFWSQVSGPGTASFDDLTSLTTNAIFTAPGTYVLRLTANDTQRVSTDDVTVTVQASPALNGATLALAPPTQPGPYVAGTQQPLRATLKDSAGGTLANYGVEFEVTGPNATTGSAVTDAAGVATFSYAGSNTGTDTVKALVRGNTVINSNLVSMTWTLTQASPPSVPGWIGGPANQSTVTGIVPVTVGAGVTLTQGTVSYWPVNDPSNVTTLTDSAQGGPGATVASLDTTLLANGAYVVRLTGTDANGQTVTSQILINVAGENKPGRLTVAVTDLTVPVTGMPIKIGRTYDSLERGVVGDFGHGWSLTVGSPRLEVSADHDVTLTEPSGRRVTFNFAPQSFGGFFGFFYFPSYTPEPGVYGKLNSDGCGLMVKSGGQLICFLEGEYRPTTYTYTDPYGRVYTMSADGSLRSVKDLTGNQLTFSASGITSSAGGLSVGFTRDSQNRITQIVDPNGDIYGYNYDSQGNLSAVNLPGVGAPVNYAYNDDHFLLSTVDARGNAEATMTYYPDGRLETKTDAAGQTTRYAYNLPTNTTTVTHPDGGTTVTRYSASGDVLSETNPLGQTTSYAYDANRNKLSETNALGQTTTYGYDGNGNLTRVTDAAGKSITGTYTPYGSPLTATDQLGNVRNVSYDATFSPTGIRDQLGNIVTFAMNANGRPVSSTDGDGRTTRYEYNAYGNLIKEVDPLNRSTLKTYDSMGRLLTNTDPRGVVTRLRYDSVGRLLSITEPAPNSSTAAPGEVAALGALPVQTAGARITSFEYDGNGNQTARVDPLGRRTVFTFDAANRLVKIDFPDGTSVSFTRDFRGNVLTLTDQNGRVTSYTYDLAGNMTKFKRPDNTEVTLVRDAIGRVTSRTDERGNSTTYEYDPACGCQDRITKITDALGRSTVNKYDAAGRRTSSVDANDKETFYVYDARGRLTQTTHPDGTTERRTYDGVGHPLSKTDQAGETTRYAYTALGDLASVTNALNQTTSYTYDANQNLVGITDANNRTVAQEFDLQGFLIKRTQPLGMSESYTYNAVGQLTRRLDYRGKVTTYEYDSMNRLTRAVPDPSLGEPAVSYAYNAVGQRASMTDESGTTNYTYNNRDLLTAKQTPQGTLAYGYDAAGNLTSMRSSNADGASVNYAYDVLNRLEKVIDNRLGAQGTTTYSYDPAGNLAGDLRPNGVNSVYTYNSLNRLTNLTQSRGAALASYAYVLDPTGRRISATEGNGRTVGYTYDQLHRLTAETVGGDANPAANGAVSYTYDGVGNRLSRTSTLAAVLSTASAYDANDRLTTDAYDANGNTRSADGSAFNYDYENRLKRVNGGAISMVYDGDGNRVAKTAGGVTTRYLVDDLNPTGYAQVVEELVGGQVRRVYTYGHNLVSQNQLLNGSWTVSFYSHDGHGSVRMLTNAAGSVTDTYAYDAFGNLTSATGSTPNLYLYSGEQFDPHLGMYYQRERYYNQQRGRWMSTDPFDGFLGDPLMLHKYLYVHADPVNNVDPSGMVVAAEYSATNKPAEKSAPAIHELGKKVACILTKAASEVAQSANVAVQVAVQSGIIELIVCRCKGQPDTEMSIPFNRRGGPHRSVPKGGNDAHHMPSSQSSPLPHGGGPTIGMDRGDHRRTASYGRGGGPDGPDAYRQRQKDLIDQGRFREAQQMDIDDVRNKFGNKYDDAINDMLNYTDLLFEVFAKCK